MENENIIEKLASQFGQSASIKNVCGEPIQSGEKTIIPVAKIAYCLGGGYGQGGKNNKPPLSEESTRLIPPLSGEGGGGGGMLYTKFVGVYEITPTSTRFIPTTNYKNLLIGIAIGLFIKAIFSSKRRCKK